MLAYSYIGPSLTWPIYRTGTIGLAKKDLETAVRALDGTLRTTRELVERAYTDTKPELWSYAERSLLAHLLLNFLMRHL